MKSKKEKNSLRLFLNNIRSAQNETPVWKQIVITFGILLLGVVLGTFSKYLDCSQGELPYILGLIDRIFDIHNFLGRFAPWIFIAVCIAVYSKTPIRGSVNVAMFFIGMVSSYFLYSKYIGGFFSESYALIWVGFTLVSPLFAYICWYAKGKGKIALAISAGIIGVLFNTAFSYGIYYFNIRYVLELWVLVIAILILQRTKWETLAMIGIGIVLAFIMNVFLPSMLW